MTDDISDEISYLYDFSGNQLAQYGQQLLTYSLMDNNSYVYDQAGNQLAQLTGAMCSFRIDSSRW